MRRHMPSFGRVLRYFVGGEGGIGEMEIGREGGLDSRADGPKEAKVQRGERGVLKFNSSKSDLS